MTRPLIVFLVAAGVQAGAFEPPRVVSSPFGGVPWGARAAGVVVLDVDVDDRGRVRGVETVKDVEPFGDSLRSSVSSWTFEPARDDGQAVEYPVLVAALVRPAMLQFPAPPPPPPPPPDAPEAIAFPTEIAVPPYPANRVGGAAVLVEVEIDDRGRVVSAEIEGETSGFDDAALEAARRWVFRPAKHEGRGVPSRAYLLFVFRPPV